MVRTGARARAARAYERFLTEKKIPNTVENCRKIYNIKKIEKTQITLVLRAEKIT